MNRPWKLLFLLFVLAGCDSPTETARQPAEIHISPEDVYLLGVNRTEQLTATAKDDRGNSLTGVAFEWESSNPSVVSVTATGRVTAAAAGVAEVSARAGSVRGTVVVGVAGPLPTSCASVLSLEVGQVFTAPAGEGSLLCLAGGAGGAEYTIIPFYGARTAGASVSLEVASQGGVQVATPLAVPQIEAARAGLDLEPALPARSSDWELRLREREIRDLTPLIPLARQVMAERAAAPRASFSTAAAVPAIGSHLTLNVNHLKSCSDPINRTGEVVAVTDRAVVIADTLNPAGGFTRAEFEELGRSFDQLVYPVITGNFGTPSDIDQNGRVMIFFTGAVNDMSTQSTIVGGFFYGRDLFPKTGNNQQQACAASNQAELLYMMVPDPTRAVSQRAFSKQNVERTTLGVLAHELQHLINSSQRLFVQRTGNFEETWLNEGLSHIAEELMGNHVGGFGRRSNIGIASITQSAAATDAFNRYHRSNVDRLARFLEAPSTTAAFDPDAPLASRGAVWQFLRYVADRHAATDEATLWKAMTNTSTSGLRNLRNALGSDPAEWLRDWSVAVYTDDAGLTTNERWIQPGWNFRSLFNGLTDYRRFPLATRSLPASGSLSLTINAGGSAYLRYGVEAGTQAQVRTSSGGLTPPHRLLFSVVRTR